MIDQLGGPDVQLVQAGARAALARRRQDDPIRELRAYEDDPVGFLTDILGVEHWFAEQEELCYSVVENRITDVQAGHGVSKTFTAGRLALWWIYAVGGAFVSTAPGFRQVRRHLWKEIRRGYNVLEAKYGRAVVGSCDILQLTVDEYRYGYGFSAPEWNPDSALGEHEGRLLVIADEANGIGQGLWEALNSLTTGEENRRLNISNPTASGTPFYRSCNARQLEGIHKRIKIPVWSHPNITAKRELVPGAVTMGWIDGVREEYREDSSYWQSRINAEFPEESEGALVSRKVFEDAIARWERNPDKWKSAKAPTFGVDVGERRDRTAIAEVRGAALLGLKSYEPVRDDREIARGVARVREHLKEAKKGAIANVDGIGVGAGLASVLISERDEKKDSWGVRSVRVSESALKDEEYKILRDELAGTLRDRFYKGTVAVRPPRDSTEERAYEALKDELAAMHWDRDVHGRFFLEAKDKTKARLGRSPDHAEAVMLGFFKAPGPPENWKPAKKSGRYTSHWRS